MGDTEKKKKLSRDRGEGVRKKQGRRVMRFQVDSCCGERNSSLRKIPFGAGKGTKKNHWGGSWGVGDFLSNRIYHCTGMVSQVMKKNAEGGEVWGLAVDTFENSLEIRSG